MKKLLTVFLGMLLITPLWAKSKVSLNQNFIEGVYSQIDISNPDEVFKLVFNHLPNTVVVYPTENYFYFSFNANGKTIWGNLRLDAHDRDDGILHLGYFEYDENGKFQDVDGYEKDFNRDSQVQLEKKSKFEYTVTFNNKTVLFKLNDVGMTPPKKAKLRSDEHYIGPVFDESGVQFFLVFNKTKNHFMYVLNEDNGATEKFRNLKNGVLVGKRTGFAFYDDKANTRKVLVAINGMNVKRNNYYDGPFDQLPDNYVDQTKIKDFIELAYPEVKGKINQFGHFNENAGNRVMIASYLVYFEDNELDFVQSCRDTFKDGPEFYACITPDRI